jgi:sec-independent protein translocase protein TatA
MPFLSPALAFMDVLGGSEMLVIFLLVLIFFGGEKLPDFARGAGKMIREFKKAAAGVEEEFKRALDEDEHKKSAPPPPPTTFPPYPPSASLPEAPAVETIDPLAETPGEPPAAVETPPAESPPPAAPAASTPAAEPTIAPPKTDPHPPGLTEHLP